LNKEVLKKPGLFGLTYSNRDFSKILSWGKNQFNSSFPVAVTCYLASKGIDPVYLRINESLEVEHSTISNSSLFGLAYNDHDLFFSFESDLPQYRTLAEPGIPRIDLVTMNSKTNESLMPIEIKLTAIPDNSTCQRSEELYGSELVIRPDTIVYLALGIAERTKEKTKRLKEILNPVCKQIKGWINASDVLPLMPALKEAMVNLSRELLKVQTPLVLQPIWKTQGKLPVFADSCFDVFVWSDLAFTRLLLDQVGEKDSTMTRPARSLIWIIRMLHQYANTGRINHKEVLSESNYNAQTDKAFAVNGFITNRYMKSPRLLKPSISKYELKNIILGGGHKYLSPERRLDAVIYYSDKLFEI
jgi:hypothetical protein